MFTLVIHGGAGAISRDRYSADEIEKYEAALHSSLDAGIEVLKNKGTALDAVSAAVQSMENCPLFNAGKGSVLSADGRIQMDAGIMCGASGECGAVTLVENIRNPILAARMVMEKTAHRLLGAKDAEEFAKKNGLKTESPEYFKTEIRTRQLKDAQQKGVTQLDHDGDESNTVGAVALDEFGNLAAATSTGGMTNKLSGRVSDTSIIGAGTYADNQTLAFSATGTGDVFIRNVSAYDAHALMAYKNLSLNEACTTVLEKIKQRKGEGGVIALTCSGEVFMGFNSGGMFRGVKDSAGRIDISIF